MTGFAKAVLGYRDLFCMLVGRTLTIRYKKSALGFLWSLLAPAFLILIYSVFLTLLKIPIDLPSLVTGIVVWQFVAMTLSDSLHAVVGNSNLVTKACFPRILLPSSMLAANFVNFLLSLGVVAGFLLLTGQRFGPLWMLPIVLASHVALVGGVAFVVSACNVFFRDTEHILGIVLLAWFFVTPVIYTADRVLDVDRFPPWLHWVYFANPMTGILCAYRRLMLSSPSIPIPLTVLSFSGAWAMFALGIAVFRRAEPFFGDEL